MNKIHRYPILGLLGRGGMARVFKVQIPGIAKVVALKVLWPDPLLEDLLGWDKLEALFTKEARILGALDHPHIVAIWDFNTWNDRPYYLMDCHAITLGHLMGEPARPDEPSRTIPVNQALDYTRQILMGLDRLHYSQIIHRDIKPYNMLIYADHQIKIGDFGLSRLHGDTYYGPTHLKVGSPGYAAPEQIEDPDGVDERADLFSAGVILYRMLTGNLPDPGRGSCPVSQDHPDLDHKWDSFLTTALATRRGARFSCAAAMLEALQDLSHHWRRQQAQICMLDEAAPQPPTPQPTEKSGAMIPLRHTPIKIASPKAPAAFGLDPQWRPKTYIHNRLKAENPGILHDEATGLSWQQSGSRYPCTWQDARAYVDKLNRKNWGGRNDWRLPTMAELLSLVQPPAQGRQLCLSSIFNPRQTRLWSADRRSFTSAWYVELELGFAGWLDFTAALDVRGVCRAA